jgi:hypothetical protein
MTAIPPAEAVMAKAEWQKLRLFPLVPHLVVQTPADPGGLAKSVFDDLQDQLAANPPRLRLSMRICWPSSRPGFMSKPKRSREINT